MSDFTQARRFNQELYNHTDELAKEMFKAHLKDTGHSIVSEIEDYNHDLVTMKDGVTHYFELELNLSNQFKGKSNFKYNKVSFLGRKKRLHKLNSYHYIIMCPNTGWAVGCDSDVIFNEDYYVEGYANTTHKNGLDGFYRVPKELCYFFKLENQDEKTN